MTRMKDRSSPLARRFVSSAMVEVASIPGVQAGKRLLAAALVAAGVSIVGPVAVSEAHPDPDWAAFCPPYVDSTTTINGSSRCAGAYRNLLEYVDAVTANGSGVDHCAILKPQSDGGGANIGNHSCGTAQVQEAYVPTYSGYPTIVNQSTSAHNFWGQTFDY